MPHPNVLLPARTAEAPKAASRYKEAKDALRIYCYKNRTTAKEFFAKRREERQKEKAGSEPVFQSIPVLVGSHFYV